MSTPQAFMYRQTASALLLLSTARHQVAISRKAGMHALQAGDFNRVMQCLRAERAYREFAATLHTEILRGDYASH